jgi:hypothetical protein
MREIIVLPAACDPIRDALPGEEVEDDRGELVRGFLGHVVSDRRAMDVRCLDQAQNSRLGGRILP